MSPRRRRPGLAASWEYRSPTCARSSPSTTCSTPMDTIAEATEKALKLLFNDVMKVMCIDTNQIEAAGLPVVLQFGETQWWYCDNSRRTPCGSSGSIEIR